MHKLKKIRLLECNLNSIEILKNQPVISGTEWELAFKIIFVLAVIRNLCKKWLTLSLLITGAGFTAGRNRVLQPVQVHLLTIQSGLFTLAQEGLLHVEMRVLPQSKILSSMLGESGKD